jgi:hypothetical protein
MNKENFVKLEETVNRYLKSGNEDYVNDFNHMVKVFEEYGMNDGKLVDIVVKHYFNKLLVDGKLAKDHTQYNKQQLINGKTVLEQWVGAIETEKRNEYLSLFNEIYKKADIPTKVCLYGHKERKNTEFVKAMQLRGEKVKKEDFNVDDVDGSTKPLSNALGQIHSLGEAMVKDVNEYLTSTDEWNDNVFTFTDTYYGYCMDIVKEAYGIQCEKQQVKKNLIQAMIDASKYHLGIAYDNIELSTKPKAQYTPSTSITVIDGEKFMNE